MSETASNTSSNIAYANAFTSGPVRTGIFATGSTARATSGAGYYGNMELSGNLWERVVTLGNATGRTFSGVHGNGAVTTAGASDVSGWPAAAGTGWKGGAYDAAAIVATASDRNQAANGNNSRAANAGGRGVRTISSGIVTDGLVLWLDAGITSSYPTSGNTWTDLSGNRNNGTLTNGPTYNTSNGGSIVFDGVNDYVTTSILPFEFLTTGFTVSIVFKYQQTTTNDNLISWGFSAFNGTSYSWEIRIRENFSVEFSPGIGPSGSGIPQRLSYSQNPVLNNRFAVIDVSYNANGIASIYENSILKTTLDYTGVGFSSATNALRIGRGTDSYFPGNISSTIIYNRVLSAAEILQNFNALKSRFGL
jgi:hypothetical protein